MAILDRTFEGAVEGAVLTSANTGFTQVLGSGTATARAAAAHDGTMGARLTYTATGQTVQFIETLSAASATLSLVFKETTPTNYAAIPQTARFYVGTTNMVAIRPHSDGRITIQVNGVVVFTSTATRPLTGARHSLWASVNTANGAAGSVSYDCYQGNSTTPLPGLSFSTAAANLGTSPFTSVQLGRPGSAADTTTQDIDSVRIRTAPDAASKDTAGTSLGTPPVAAAATVATVTTVDWAGSTGTLSAVSATPTVPGLTTSGLRVSFTEVPGRVSTTIAGTLTNDGQSIPVSKVVPALEGGGVQRIGDLVRVTPTSGWI